MTTWWNEVRQAARNTAELTPANQMVLAYQFAHAREKSPDGFTMNLYGEVIHPENGYAVGITPTSFDNVADALDATARIQAEYGFANLHLGFWRDGSHDYIDVVMVTNNREMAERLGRRMNQHAIWDFSSGSEIWLKNEEENSDARWELRNAAEVQQG
jgi:hypothetical protein